MRNDGRSKNINERRHCDENIHNFALTDLTQKYQDIQPNTSQIEVQYKTRRISIHNKKEPFKIDLENLPRTSITKPKPRRKCFETFPLSRKVFPSICVIFLCLLSLFISPSNAQSFKNVHLGFPDAWNGDKYPELYCPAKNIPKFLDGYFLCQLSAAYGNPAAPPGQRLNHMIDAIGAVGAFHISNGEVWFSAQYYPARPYKIWDYYDRNMSKASVPWVGWSDYNLTAMSKWEQVPQNPDAARFHPNLDFWRVGKKLIAGTEAPYWVGYEFDVRNLNKFKLFPFTEDNDIFGNPRPNLIPISMAIHERMDHGDGGSIWGTFTAMNFDEQRFFQGIFTVNPNGVRRVVGMYDYGVWDANACAKDDEYIGDKMLLPGYIHSITSTENYIILPITSLLINPCKFKEPPRSGPPGKTDIQAGGLWGMDFYDMVPMRFLVFDKRTRSWITNKPMEVFPSMFVTHQLNAYENLNGNIVADMVVYDSHDPYVKYFYTDFLTSQVYPSTARILRFTLDLREFRVMYSYLIPQETIAADFPQVNHAFDSHPYQWAYVVEHPFAGGNQILKINVDEPAGARNRRFRPEDAQMVLHEPWFIAKPGASREDDGILMIRALDLEENKGVLLVVDATTMVEIGRAFVPISIPFGFHNRFFASADLGLPPADEEDNRVNEEDEIGAFVVNPEGYKATKPLTGYGRGKWERKWEKKVRGPEPTVFGGRRFWSRINELSTTTARSQSSTVSWVPIYPSVPDGGEEEPFEGPLRNTRPTPLPWWPSTAHPLPQQPPRPFGGGSYIRPDSLLPLSPPPPEPPQFPQLLATPAPPLPQVVAGGGGNFVEATAPPPPHPPLHRRKSGANHRRDRGDDETTSRLTVRQLYERTLRALCRWLPRIFKHITYQGCITGGQRAIKWMSPLAQRISNNHLSSSFSASREEGGNRFPKRSMEQGSDVAAQSWLRPVLKPREPSPAPWYNYRTTAKSRINDDNDGMVGD